MLELIQSGKPLTLRQRLALTAKLSWPAIMAQLSSILMQYIDAAMVGRLGAVDSAAVGLVSTSLWLFWGVCSAATVGFSVQVAHAMGAAEYDRARDIMRQGILISFLFGVLIAAVGMSISQVLPVWLGGEPEICAPASGYFLVFVSALPLLSLNYIGCGVLRAAGNMKVPGGLNVMMCALDVVFNFLLIFPTRDLTVFGSTFRMPGAGLGIWGAALGTVCAEIITAGSVIWYLLTKQEHLALTKVKGKLKKLRISRDVSRKAIKVAAPMTLEHAVICGAQIMITVIVAPLGAIAIAANAFAVTAEALCYMPGYGIGDAATTLTGQSYGAGRKDLARQFGYITTLSGMVIMSAMGIMLWIFAPTVMSMMSPVQSIVDLGAEILRIEAWAEPMFAASIVAYGAMVGVGDTIVPACMNFMSIWLVRVPLAAILAPIMGLRGVWIAMCIELCFRGTIFLWRLIQGAWLKHGLKA